MAVDQKGRAFTHDAENVLRLVQQSVGGATLASYAYYGDGARKSKTAGGATATFYYDADQELAEYEGSILKRRYLRLPGSVDEPFLMIDLTLLANDNERWAHQNRLGSVVAVTSKTAAIVELHKYGAYGELGMASAAGFPFRFTGQKLDPETGLYYYKARYYDPETGRFLQTDPIGYEDQMNLYAYVGNDPTNILDPAGEDAVVLNTRPFAPSWAGMEHQAILIGNDSDGWVYISRDAKGKTGVKQYRTLEEALNSPEIADRYSYAYRAQTTREQDEAMLIAGAISVLSEEYDFRRNNCGDLVKKCLDAAGVRYPDTLNPADARKQSKKLPEWKNISDQIGSKRRGGSGSEESSSEEETSGCHAINLPGGIDSCPEDL